MHEQRDLSAGISLNRTCCDSIWRSFQDHTLSVHAHGELFALRARRLHRISLSGSGLESLLHRRLASERSTARTARARSGLVRNPGHSPRNSPSVAPTAQSSPWRSCVHHADLTGSHIFLTLPERAGTILTEVVRDCSPLQRLDRSDSTARAGRGQSTAPHNQR